MRPERRKSSDDADVYVEETLVFTYDPNWKEKASPLLPKK